MKPLKQTCIALLVLTLLVVGCDSDDNNDTLPDNSGYIDINGTRYSLSHGLLENYGDFYSDENTNIDIHLFSSGFDYITGGNGSVQDIIGEGHYAYFEILSSEEELVSGDYVLSDEGDDDTLYSSHVEINVGFDEGNSFERINLSSGLLTITIHKNRYELSYASENDGVTIDYQGTLEYYDYRELDSNFLQAGKIKKSFRLNDLIFQY